VNERTRKWLNAVHKASISVASLCQTAVADDEITESDKEFIEIDLERLCRLYREKP
jgi:hypothetical protein